MAEPFALAGEGLLPPGRGQSQGFQAETSGACILSMTR
jgi:hypothetical protein